MSSSPIQDNEPFPVDSNVAVIKGKTIYKNKKWWFAVLLVNSFGHNKISHYQWQWTEIKRKDPSTGNWVPSGQFKWKRKQKITYNFVKNWEDAEAVTNEFIKEGGLS